MAVSAGVNVTERKKPSIVLTVFIVFLVFIAFVYFVLIPTKGNLGMSFKI